MASNLKKYMLALLITGAAIVWTQPLPSVHAQGLNSGFNNVDTIRNISKIREFKTPKDFIFAILTPVLAFMGAVATAAIIYGGFLYVTAAGDEKKAETAKHVIIYAVIGLIIIGGAALLTNVIISAFKNP